MERLEPMNERAACKPRTFFEKVWDDHVIADLGENNWLLAIDRLVLHDMSGSESTLQLDKSGRMPARPDLVFATIDHFIRTDPGRSPLDARAPEGLERMQIFRKAAKKFGLRLFDVGDPRQGITHVMAAQTGAALPGLSIVCGDSHTSTLGGLGAFAWGIGSTEGIHVLATQTLTQARPKTMRVNFKGTLRPNVFAKDLILALIGKIGAQGGINYAVEYSGEALRSLPMEGRFTICNMTIEFSGKYGFVPPDDVTFEYIRGREFAPQGKAWDQAVAYWRTLPSEEGAIFDREIDVDCSELEPQVTWGISPQQVFGISGRVPDPHADPDSATRKLTEDALDYIGLQPGVLLEGLPIDAAYIGSCTNAWLQDLREAARVLDGKKIAPGIQALCVPGSSQVKAAAEAEGLDKIFRAAGFEWHESGCGNCGGMGNKRLIGLRVISTTNRNFENRQGKGTRTHLASPATVAASAIAGTIADVRKL
jgi:3-isopropylmalate/(R)-2-methylmalate dehydratase large subunit